MPDIATQRARAIAVYDSYVDGYDQSAEVNGFLSPGRIAALLAAAILDREACILDVACGTGLAGAQLYRLGFRNLTGIDITFSMLRRARAKKCYGLVAVADAHAPLPFAARSFDAIVCAGAFYDEDIHVTALENMLPLLKPGGYLFCDIEMHAWDHYGFRELFAHPEILAICAALTIEPGHFFRVPADEDPHGYYVRLRVD